MSVASIEYSRREGVVRITSDAGTVTTVPIADFEADPEQYTSAATLIADARREALAKLAEIRWERTQTFIYDGVRTPSSDTAVAYVTGAVVAIQARQPPPTVNWKLAPGEFRTWDLTQLIAFGSAMRDYIQACFDREEVLAQAIAAATTSREVMAIDLKAGWPVTAEGAP
jgi:hypothetical protein